MKKMLNRKQKAFVFFSFAIFLIITLITLTIMTIYVDNVIYKNEIDDIILYQEKGALKPLVCLKENEYITDECLDENRSFVANLIDKIKLELKYNLTATDIINYSYNYNIKVKTLAYEKGEESKVLYVKEETLKEGTSNNTSSLIILDEILDLDYQKYNAIITSFKKNYVVALDSKLIVTATINVMGENPKIKEQISNTYTLITEMPLAELTVNINDINNEINESKVITEYKDKTNSKKYHILADLLYLIDFFYLLTITLLIILLIPRKKEYNKKVKKILKSYDDVIVIAKKMPDLKKLNVIEVNDFKELLNARESLNKPIIYFETTHKDSSSFIITNENYAYLYVVNAIDKVEHV